MPRIREMARHWLPRDQRGIAVFLGVYAGLLLFFRPATPFEWDEVLYQRALDHYDVAGHAPHPPGAPLFIWVAKALQVVVRDPQLAIQGTAIVAALVGLVCLYRLAQRLGASAGAATAAVVLLAMAPGFCFHANVGLSDIPSTAGVIAAVLAFVAAIDDPRRLPMAAAVTALALGVRPQVFPVLLPVGVAVIVSAIRGRHWKRVGLAVLAGVATSVAVWLPAMLLTGFQRYWSAVLWHAHYLATVESGYYFPHVPFRDVVKHWLVSPLGDERIAMIFGFLVLTGGATWWLTGRRRLVLVAAGSGLLYVTVAACSMNVLSAVRFALPAAPFFALLAAGNLAIVSRWLRWPAIAVCAWFLVAAVAWGLPVYVLRREPAPVWAAFTWIKQHLDPARTTIVIDGGYIPHIQYVLKNTGFAYEETKDSQIYAAARRPAGEVVIVLARPVPGCEVLFEKTWHEPKVLQLAFQRYGSCAVMRGAAGPGPRFSPNVLVDERGWVVWATLRMTLPEGDAPRMTAICPRTERITVGRAGFPATTADPGQCLDVPIFPGPAGEVTVQAPKNLHALLTPLEFSSDPARIVAAGLAGPELVVPLAVYLRTGPGTVLRSDVTVANLEARPLRVTAALLPWAPAHGPQPLASAVVAAGGTVRAEDLLARPGQGGDATLGALVIDAAWAGEALSRPPAIMAFTRTHDARAGDEGSHLGEGLVAYPATAGVGVGGTASFAIPALGKGARIGLSAAALSRAPVEMDVTQRDAAGNGVATATARVPACGLTFEWLPEAGMTSTVILKLTRGPADARVYPCVTVVDGPTGRLTLLQPQQVQNPQGTVAPLDWRSVATGSQGRGSERVDR